MNIIIGTWNVHTLFRSRALKELIDEAGKYGINTLAVQEMRWLGRGKLDQRSCNVYYSCKEKQHYFGSEFMVNRRTGDKVIDLLE